MLELIEATKEFTGLTVLTVVFLVASGVLVISNRTADRRARAAFLGVIGSLILIALADWFTTVTSGSHPELAVLHTLLMTITFIIAPGIPVVLAQVIFPDRSVKWMMGLVIVHGVIQLVNIAGGFIFYVDDANVYHRGSLYPVYMAAYSITALYLVVESVRAGHVYQSMSIFAAIGILLCMLTGVAIQVFDSSVRMTWPAVSMAVVLYFLFYCDMVTRVDPLTKLLNRRSYEEALAKHPQKCVAVVIDVDDFKTVNDNYGHAFGDEVLERVAAAIRRSFGAAGQCYRTGGDEFAVIVTKNLDGVQAMVDDLRRQGEKVIATDNRAPTCSVGYAAVDDERPDIEAAFAAADVAMYETKRDRGVGR